MPKSKLKSKVPADPATPTLSLKEALAQKRKAALERKQLISFAVTVFFSSALLALPLMFIGGPKLAGGAIAAIICCSFSLKYPNQGLWALLVYVPLGGTITYSLGNSPLLQLAKDLLFYLPALFGLYQYCKQKRVPFMPLKPLLTPIWLLLGSCLLTLLFANGIDQLSAKGESPFLLGILGLKVLMGYIPLIGCAYYLIRSKKDLLFLSRLQVLLIILCCGLAFVQYRMLETGKCEGTRHAVGAALYKASLDARCFVGGSLLYSPDQGVIRLPGTFVAPWQWGWFLISSAFFSFAATFNETSLLWRVPSLASMVLVFILAVVSGQRIALIMVPIVIVILLFVTGQITNLKKFVPIAGGLALILGIAMISNPGVVQERWDSFVGRWNASPPTDFIADQAENSSKSQDGILGNGLGRATNSARALGQVRLIETYYPKLLYEIGPIGTLAFLILVSTLTFHSFKAYRSVRDPTLRGFAASFWVFVLLISYNTYYYPLDVDPVAVYYWFYAGVLLKIPELDRQERVLQESQAESGSAKSSNAKSSKKKRRSRSMSTA